MHKYFDANQGDGASRQRGAWISGLYTTIPILFWGQTMRTQLGRLISSMRLKTSTATLTSVARHSSIHERKPSPITCFHRLIDASTLARWRHNHRRVRVTLGDIGVNTILVIGPLAVTEASEPLT